MDSKPLCCELVLDAAARRLAQETTRGAAALGRAVLEAPWGAQPTFDGRIRDFARGLRDKGCLSEARDILALLSAPPLSLGWGDLLDSGDGPPRRVLEAHLGALAAAGIRCPEDLEAFGVADLELALGRDAAALAAAKVLAGRLSQGASPRLPMSARGLAAMIDAKEISDTALAGRLRDLSARVGLRRPLTDFQPSKIAGHLRALGVTPRLASELADLTRAVRTLGSFRGSLRSVASGLRAWASFCEATGETQFPVSREAARRFSSWHRSADTYGIYLHHVQKGCLLLGLPVDWYQDRAAFNDVIRGTKRLCARLPRDRPLVTADVLRMMIEGQSMSEERVFSFLAWVFLLRAASEATDVRRAKDGVSIANLKDAPPGSWISLEGRTLFLKLGKRKNRPLGDVISRVCSCVERGRDTSAHCGAALCPVHVLWAQISGAIAPGDFLFSNPRVPATSARWARERLISIGAPHAANFGLHDLRRGAAQQLVSCGGSLATILRAGSWSSKAFLVYLDQAGLERDAMARMTTHLPDFEAPEGEP